MKVTSALMSRSTLALPQWVVIVGIVATIVLLIVSGDLTALAVITGLAFFTVLSWYHPIPLVALLLVLSTQVFQFVSFEDLPYLQLFKGIRLNAQDIAVVLLLVIGGCRLFQRQERPLFIRPLIFFGLAIVLSSGFGWVAGTTSPGATLNALRAYSGYLFYVGLVGVMDTPRRMKAIINIIFLLVLVSVGIQLLEAIQGERIVSPFVPSNEYFSGTKTIVVGNVQAPYLWNRGTGYLFLGLFLALGALLGKKIDTKHMSVGLLAIIGFVIALVRQWFIFLLCGLLVLGALSRGKRFRTLGKFVGVGLLLFVALNLISYQIPGFPLLEVLGKRIDTIIAFQQEPNYVSRVVIQFQMLALFSRSPIFGYGLGSGLINSDVGVFNALVELGIVGTASIAYLIGFVFVEVYRRWKKMPDSLFRAYLAGLLAAWAALVVGYAFSVDLIGQMSMSVGLAMALMERISTFAAMETNLGRFHKPRVG